MTLAELDAAIAEDPARFTPWLSIYLADHRERLFGGHADQPLPDTEGDT